MSEMIGRLRVALGLETAAFEKGAKRAAAEIDTFGGKAEKAGFAVGSMAKAVVAGGVALAGSAVVSQIKDMVMAGLEYASALGEQAQQLGVTAKAMQEYRYVASQTGVSNEEMDAALAKLNRTAGDAAGGSKKAQAAFEALGISVRDANGNVKDAGALIPEIAAALEKVPSPAERASALVDLFGKSGQKLAPLMAEGAGGVNKLREEAHKLGLVLSDEQIQKADATADKIAELNQQLNARVAGVVADNADSIMKLVNALAALAEKMFRLIDLGADFAKSPAGRLLGNLGTAASWTNPVGTSMRMLEQVDAAVNGTGRPATSGGGSTGTARALPQSWGKTSGAPMLQGSSAYRGLTNFAGGSTLLPSASGTFAGMQPGNASGLFPWIVDDAQAMQHASEILSQTVDDNAEKVDVANVQIARSFGEMAQDSINALDRLASAVQGGGALNIISAILGVGLQLGGMGLFGKSIQTNINAPRIPAYAGGTSFHPGGLALVGERGPEIVSMPRGSSVYPNGQGPGMQVQVIPSPYFDVRVMQNVGAAAPAIASAGGELGYARMAKQGARHIGFGR